MFISFRVKLTALQLLVLLGALAGCVAASAGEPAVTSTPTPSLTPAQAMPTQTSTASHTPAPTIMPTATSTIPPTSTATAAPVVLIGAGDVVVCGVEHDEQTAALVEQQLAQFPNATIFIAGDVVNESGRAVEYKNCFTPSWGRFLDRIRPVAGNHDTMTDQGAPYYAYFGSAAGEPGKGYYSYNLGSWHIVALNSNCDVIACGKESQQVKWLREDLQQNQQRCTLIYLHHPRFSSGLGGSFGSVSSFWRAAYEFGADVVISGNDHDYERFAPQDPDGNPDPGKGIREFVVGTGGAELRAWGTLKPNSEARDNQTHGVIRFKLYPEHYEWDFLPAEGGTFTDSGSGTCH